MWRREVELGVDSKTINFTNFENINAAQVVSVGRFLRM